MSSAGIKNINVVALFRARYITHLMNVCKCSHQYAIELVNKVYQNDGLFSGSSVLQVLLGEKYDGSDIDIYFPKKSVDNMSILMSNLLMADVQFDLRNLDYFTQMKIRHSKNINFILGYDYRTANNCDTPYEKIQIIFYYKQMCRPIHILATENFDLSITMNSFTGKAVETYNFEMLANKRSIQFTSFSHSNREKYINRGISINEQRYLMIYIKILINILFRWYRIFCVIWTKVKFENYHLLYSTACHL